MPKQKKTQAITEQLTDTTKHISRGKNTRAWCRGKPGREHQIVVAMPPNLDGFMKTKPCGWRSRADWAVQVEPRWYYHCNHVELCLECGRIFRRQFWLDNVSNTSTHLGREECPHYVPMPTDAS